ncbi:MAG TPA: hypothetical protein VGJ91_10990 [Polyangiaceae bacterium]
MIRVVVRCTLALALLVGVDACDGGEIVVFSTAEAGSAGSVSGAGSGGVSSGAGAGALAGSLNAAGDGGIVTSGGGSGGGGPVDKPCQTIADCDPSWLCQKQFCSDPQGVCLPLPVSEDPLLSPVCGCDHKTYWNDTLRQTFGIPASTMGECRSGAQPCSSSDECGSNGACSQKLPNPNACAMPGSGQCWVTPTDCAADSEKPHWLPCTAQGVPPNSPPPACLTTCQALQSGSAYWQAPKNVCD